MKNRILLFLLFAVNWPAANAIIFEVKSAITPPFSGDSTVVLFQKTEPLARPKKSSKPVWTDGLTGLSAFISGSFSTMSLLALFITGIPGWIIGSLITAILGVFFLRKALKKQTEAEWRASQMALLIMSPVLLIFWLFGMLAMVYLAIAVTFVSAFLVLPMLLFIYFLATGRRLKNPGRVKKVFSWFPDLIVEVARTGRVLREAKKGTKRPVNKGG